MISKKLLGQIGSLLLLVIAGSVLVFAGEASAPYVVLLDVSGSMERDGATRYSRYTSGLIAQIVGRLANAIASADNHAPIYVQPFSSSRQSFAGAGPLTAAQIKNALPTSASGQETELDAGLRVGMQGRPDSYLFVLTDNKNDFSGSRSDHEFYNLLAKSPAIHTVYFVPLAQPDAKDALVLYAVACGTAHRSTLRHIASEFAKSSQSDAVQFRGFYDDKEQESLTFGQHVTRADESGEESPATMEGDAIVLPYDEGRSVDGTLKFRIHSSLKHWRIKDGELRKVEARVQVPQEFGNAGEYQLPLAVSGGRKMNVAPGGDSAEVYTLPLSKLSDAGVSLVRRNLFKTSLPEITARIHISAVVHVSQNVADSGIRPDFSPALKNRIEAVRNLPDIMNLMTFQPDANPTSTEMERVIPVNRDILIRVKPNPLKNLLAGLIKYGLPALLLAAIAGFLIVGQGKVYTITEPGERTRPVKFSAMTRSVPIIWNGRRVATLHKTSSGFLVRPEIGYSAEPTAVAGNPARFEIRNLKSGDTGSYQVRSGAAPVRAAAHRGQL